MNHLKLCFKKKKKKKNLRFENIKKMRLKIEGN